MIHAYVEAMRREYCRIHGWASVPDKLLVRCWILEAKRLVEEMKR